MATVTIAARSLKKGKAYVVQYVDPATAQKIYHKSFRRKDLAQEEVNRLRTLLDGGQFPEKKPRKGAALPLPTFGQAARICKEEWRRKLGENNISENTHAGYISLLTPVEIMWRHTLLRDITVDDVRDYRIEIAQKTKADLKRQGKEGKNCNVLANRRLFVIKQVFALAQKQRLIEEDKIASIPYLSEKDSERKVAQTPMGVEALLIAAYQQWSRHYLPLAILLAVEHGCSRQEVLSLKWSDICLAENIITFHRTKNSVTRTHRIMPRTHEALLARRKHLDQYREKRGIKAKGDYVIGNMDGTPFCDIKTAWKSLCKNQSFDDLHFHDHRHTYCTNLLMSGSTLKETSVMIGHKDLRMTNRYSNLEGVMDSRPLDRLAARYAGADSDDQSRARVRDGLSEAADI